jgi:peptide/nickel transport system ATP-binding protein
MKNKVDVARYQEVPILSVRDLNLTYFTSGSNIHAVRQVTFNICRGQAYGLVGESGSGKSSIAFAIIRYLPSNGKITNGRINFHGRDIYKLTEKELLDIRGRKISLVPQDPLTSLNPSHRIGDQISETFRIHYKMSRLEAYEKTIEVLTQINMPDPHIIARKYPHEISGGQQQRVLISMAFYTNPDLLILDEPTTGLDVTTEVRIIDLIREMKQKYKAAILYISHNLGVVKSLCDRVGIIYAGEIVEEGDIAKVFSNPFHPYTLGLLHSIPRINLQQSKGKLDAIEGFLPDLTNLNQSCIFSPRCQYSENRCFSEVPPLKKVGKNRSSKCFFYDKLLHSIIPKTDKRTVEHKTIFTVSNNEEKLLKIDNYKYKYRTEKGNLRAVDGVSLRCKKGEVLGIVGESGCGKTTLARCIVGLLEVNGISDGHIYFKNQNIVMSHKKRSRKLLRNIQMVFQNPDASLNPQKTVEQILSRPLKLYNLVPMVKLKARVIELLESVILNKDYLSRYPHELSGGEKQRVAIARVFALLPELIICDEPISSLDVSVQAGVLNLLLNLQKKYHIAYIFITHDLNVVCHISDRIVVMYLGKICEVGTPESIFSPPYHPYTEALLSAIPILQTNITQKKIRLEGSVPSPIDPIEGCVFHTRCPRKIGDVCIKSPPPNREVSTDHIIICHIPLRELMSVTPVFNIQTDK